MTVPVRPHGGQPRVYTPEEVQALLQAGEDRVYRLMRSGELRAFKLGNRWRVPCEALEEFLGGK